MGFNWQVAGKGLASGAEGTTGALVQYMIEEQAKKEQQRQEKLQMPLEIAKRQYYERGHQPKEEKPEKPPTAKELLDQAKLESYLGLTPDEQKKVWWSKLFEADKPKPKTDAAKRSEYGFARQRLKEQDPDMSLSPEQNVEWLSNILDQMGADVPLQNIEPPRITQKEPLIEGGNIWNLFQDKEIPQAETSFFPFLDQIMPDTQTPKPPYETDSEIEKARNQLSADEFNEWLPKYLKSIGK